MDKLARTESHGGRQRPPGSSRSSRLHVACAVSIAVLTPSACGSTDEDSTQPATSTAASTTVAPVASASKNAEPTGIQAVRVAYEKLLADPAAALAQADAEYTPSSEDSFSYAIGEFTGDDRPEMLLRAGAHAANPVFVVSTDPNNTVVVARTIVRQGVNELGQDLQIRFSAAHDFIYQLTFDTIGSTTADTPPTSIDTTTTNVARTGQAEALALEGGALSSVGVYGFSLDAAPEAGQTEKATTGTASTAASDTARDFLDFAWFSSTDPAGLDALAAVSTTHIPAGSAGRVSDDGLGRPTPQTESTPTPEAAAQAGNVFTGTLVSYSAADIDGQYLAEGADPQERFLLLRLDSPITIEADSGNGTSQVTAGSASSSSPSLAYSCARAPRGRRQAIDTARTTGTYKQAGHGPSGAGCVGKQWNAALTTGSFTKAPLPALVRRWRNLLIDRTFRFPFLM